MRYLSIDYGSRKIGLALSDEDGTMGFPYGVLPNSSELIDQLIKLISEKDVGAVVMGESRNFSGQENPIAEGARKLAGALKERTSVSVHFQPETYTTQEARRYPDGTRMEGSPDVDSSAAALILTAFLEKHNQ